MFSMYYRETTNLLDKTDKLESPCMDKPVLTVRSSKTTNFNNQFEPIINAIVL